MDEAVTLLKIPLPTYIKIDVDAIEHLILSGGQALLQYVEEVAIEVNESFSHQVLNVQKYLSAAGLSFKEKKHSAMVKTLRDGVEHITKSGIELNIKNGLLRLTVMPIRPKSF